MVKMYTRHSKWYAVRFALMPLCQNNLERPVSFSLDSCFCDVHMPAGNCPAHTGHDQEYGHLELPEVVQYAVILALRRQKQADFHEFKASLVYTGVELHSETQNQRNPVSKNKTEKKKTNKHSQNGCGGACI